MYGLNESCDNCVLYAPVPHRQVIIVVYEVF